MPVEQSLREVPVGDNLAPRAQSSAVLPAALRRRGETLFYAMILPVTAAAIWQAVALMHLLPPMLFPSVGKNRGHDARYVDRIFRQQRMVFRSMVCACAC